MDAITGGVLAGAASSAALTFLLRNWIVERLRGEISFEYQRKLEELRHEYHQLSERFNEERTEREAIRNLVLSSVTATQAGALERRVGALDTLWKSVLQLRRRVPTMIFAIDMIGYREENFGAALHQWLASADISQLVALDLSHKIFEIRPFIGEYLYALFYGLQAAYGRATTATVLSYQGGALRRWYEDDDAKSLLSIALTDDELAHFGSLTQGQLDWLWRILEEKIVLGISAILSGRDTASDNLALARQLVTSASALAAVE